MRTLLRRGWWLGLLLVAACNQLGASGPGTTPARPDIGPPVRDHLASDEAEAEGYGFYTYLLLRDAPNPSNLARYRAAFDAFLRILPRQESREAPSALNITYTLVKEPPDTDIAVSSGSLPGSPRRAAAIDWLIEHHDYDRSRRLLRALGRTTHAGPYIVQARRPLLDGTAERPTVIIQDLSDSEAELTGSIMEQVLRASEEKTSWQDDELQDWLLGVRNLWERLGVNAARVAKLVDVLPWTKSIETATAQAR